MKSVLAVRHVQFEGLGLLGDELLRRGCLIETLDAGVDDLAAIDPLAADLVVVLGGPIGACQSALYPFLRDELRIIESRLKAGRPTLGICLGAQLMALALGARVYPAGQREVGWGPVFLSKAGHHSVLHPLDSTVPVLHWHGDTFDLPPGATLLASTTTCPQQAFSLGPSALGLQFHLEVVESEIERWLIGHACEIAALAPGVTVTSLRNETKRWAPALAPLASECFRSWLASQP
ncbi:MAG: glutamine amidotransferase [Rhodospirillaceae bacterium]